MKIIKYTGIFFLAISIGSCTTQQPSGNSTVPPAITKSTLNVTVKLGGAGWNVSALTNVGLVLVPMTNTNISLLNDRFDWSNKVMHLSAIASFSYSFTNIIKNLAPAGAENTDCLFSRIRI
jgi:hypothetical protein